MFYNMAIGQKRKLFLFKQRIFGNSNKNWHAKTFLGNTNKELCMGSYDSLHEI